MDRIFPHISSKKLRYLLVCAAMFLVLLSSCPVKGGIKSLIGLPVKTEQGLNKGSHTVFGNGAERCVNTETLEAAAFSSVSIDADALLPLVLFTATFLFLLGLASGKERPRPLYGDPIVAGALPIFLRNRKLII